MLARQRPTGSSVFPRSWRAWDCAELQSISGCAKVAFRGLARLVRVAQSGSKRKSTAGSSKFVVENDSANRTAFRTFFASCRAGPKRTGPQRDDGGFGDRPVPRSPSAFGINEEVTGSAVIFQGFHGFQDYQFSIADNEIDVRVRPHVRRRHSLGKRQKSELEQISDGQLRNRNVLLLSEFSDLHTVQDFTMTEGRKGLGQYVSLPCIRDQVERRV